MNKLKYIGLLSFAFLFVQCSKKNVDKMTKAEPIDHSFRNMAPKAGPARTVEIGNYSSFDMDNGLKVIVVENHKLPRVSYQVSLLHAPILEGDNAGYVSMAGDLLSTGTKSMSKAQIDEKIDFYGANFNTSSSGMYMSSLKKHSSELLKVFTDVLYNPSFPEDEFEKAKSQTLSGLASQKTDPSSISSNVSSVVLYGNDHPYGEVQTEQSTKNITLDDCKSYYNNFFKPNNAYLIIVGDITLDEAKSIAYNNFSRWKSGKVNVKKHALPMAPKGNQVAFAHKDGAVQSVLRVTYPVDLHPTSPDVLKATAMNQILGGGVFSGRLMQNLREDKAYTYGCRSQLSSDQMVGAFNAGASVRNEVTDSSIHEIIYEMNRMVEEPVAADDLQLIKNSMAGSFARSLESPQTIARFARNIYKYDLPKDYYATYLSRLEAITPMDITAMAKKYIKPENAHIVVVGNKDDVAESLLRFDSDNKIDYYGAYGEPVNYSNKMVPDGITAKSVIEDYISSIGGKDKLDAVNNLTTIGGMAIMGQNAGLTVKVTRDGKMLNKMTMGGQVMQEQKFDGTKASVSAMGSSKVLTSDDPEYASIKSEAVLFEQVEYLTDAYNLELKGIESFEGQDCYKMIVKNGDNTETQFYATSNNLLVGSVASQGEGEQAQVITTKYEDYKDVNGILMPYKMTIIGAAPFPLEMMVEKYEVNTEIPASEFEVK